MIFIEGVWCVNVLNQQSRFMAELIKDLPSKSVEITVPVLL